MGARRVTVLIDGTCVLCNATARWIRRRDRHGVFVIEAGQSDVGVRLWQAAGRTGTPPMETVVVIDERGVWTESDAVLAIAWGLGGVWRAGGVLRVLPRFVRDGAYRVVARRRHRIFGREEVCEMSGFAGPGDAGPGRRR